MAQKKAPSTTFVGFMQAFGLVSYCGAVAFFMNNVSKWFDDIPEYFAAILMLTLFSTSALICGIITLYYPFKLFLEKKQLNQAFAVIVQMAVWLVLFVLIIAGVLLYTKSSL